MKSQEQELDNVPVSLILFLKMYASMHLYHNDRHNLYCGIENYIQINKHYR